MPFILPSEPNSTTGDARGVFSVDLQQRRNGSTKVASGESSVLGGGFANTASNTGSAVLSGVLNIASGTYSVVVGGFTNTASAKYAVVSGGRAVADKQGQKTFAAGRFAADGDAQSSKLISRNSTTDGTQTELFLNGSSLRMTIASDTTWVFECYIVARRTDADNESAGYLIQGVIDNNAGTTALVGTITKTVLAEDTAGWDVTAEADDTNDALVVKVTGEAAKTIRWVCTTRLTEVTG